MLHGFRAAVVLGALTATTALGAGLASAATTADHADITVAQSDVSASLPGEVGIAAVLAGSAGLILGLIRRQRASIARRAAERAARAAATPVAQPARTS
jgi:uncharacterized transporter YbjL